MAYMINDECVACGECEAVCPVGAITEGDPTYVIDPKKCVECKGFHENSQCAEVCPVEACVPDPEHEESEEALLARKGQLGF